MSDLREVTRRSKLLQKHSSEVGAYQAASIAQIHLELTHSRRQLEEYMQQAVQRDVQLRRVRVEFEGQQQELRLSMKRQREPSEPWLQDSQEIQRYAASSEDRQYSTILRPDCAELSSKVVQEQRSSAGEFFDALAYFDS